MIKQNISFRIKNETLELIRFIAETQKITVTDVLELFIMDGISTYNNKKVNSQILKIYRRSAEASRTKIKIERLKKLSNLEASNILFMQRIKSMASRMRLLGVDAKQIRKYLKTLEEEADIRGYREELRNFISDGR